MEPLVRDICRVKVVFLLGRTRDTIFIRKIVLCFGFILDRTDLDAMVLILFGKRELDTSFLISSRPLS